MDNNVVPNHSCFQFLNITYTVHKKKKTAKEAERPIIQKIASLWRPLTIKKTDEYKTAQFVKESTLVGINILNRSRINTNVFAK